ncbi:TetR/AcrR family transcriptional regulator [Jiella mangrovi]|uniref:TetR/AcrR family transcriptional regulator C-terminal domain-containing protein n=1 Tax=Jiella mangrovi TaxID=2821407 RepID=A0ABS4BEC0_9HYPH|nr:TetR/AcrR family transcriptional regulator [Jiella mangrovi]MBP0615098.1 TetR/AcrR family transcriptional regulator C-terminal domain-containing protein [Jiella mangrovi]
MAKRENSGVRAPAKDQAQASRQLGRAAAVGLTRERIVDAAIDLIDRKGLDALTMRELSRQLDVYPTAIYWHIGGSKADLFSDIAGALTAGMIDPEDTCADWRDTLRLLFRRFRERVHRHPNAAPLLGAQMRSNGAPNAPWVEIILAALSQAGYRDQAMVDAFNALVGGLVGFVTMELAPGPAEQTAEWEKSFEVRLDELDDERFPHTRRALPLMLNRAFVMRWKNGSECPLDTGFDALLESLLKGLELRAPANTPP